MSAEGHLQALVAKWRGQQRGWLREQPNYTKAQIYSVCADELDAVLAATPEPAPEKKAMQYAAGVPRRCRVDLDVPAERAIRAAIDAVEALPADVRLTNAVVLLGQAKDHVSDFVDGLGASVIGGTDLEGGTGKPSPTQTASSATSQHIDAPNAATPEPPAPSEKGGHVMTPKAALALLASGNGWLQARISEGQLECFCCACYVCAYNVLSATPEPAPPSGWQPIATLPIHRHEDQLFFWVVPKPPEEAYCNTSGDPIVGTFTPYRFLGKYKTWSSLSKATHWAQPLPIGPPAVADPASEAPTGAQE